LDRYKRSRDAIGAPLSCRQCVSEEASASYVIGQQNGRSNYVTRWQSIRTRARKRKFLYGILPIAITKDADLTLKEFSDEFRGPNELTIVDSKERNALGTEFTENCRNSDIRVTRNEPERPNQHPTEGDIREDRRNE
jgi:hypothetical protein